MIYYGDKKKKGRKFVITKYYLRRPGIEPGSAAWEATMLTVTPPTPLCLRFSSTILWQISRAKSSQLYNKFKKPRLTYIYPWYIMETKKKRTKICHYEILFASAGNWTWISCLGGNHANRYTTNASLPAILSTILWQISRAKSSQLYNKFKKPRLTYIYPWYIMETKKKKDENLSLRNIICVGRELNPDQLLGRQPC